MTREEKLLLEDYKCNTLPKLKELKEDNSFMEYIAAIMLIDFFIGYGYVPEA